NVYKVPQELTHEQIASIDPAAIALHAIVKGGVKIGDKVAIFGSGPIGHYVAQWAKIVGASTVIAIDIVDQKLEISKELGADHIINAAKCDDVVKMIYELTENEGVDVAFETAGSNITAEQCLKSCKKQGATVFLGTPHSDVTLKNDVFEAILRRELRTVGSWCYHFAPPIDEWKVTIQHFAKGNIKTAPLITHKFRIEDVDKAFDLVRDKKEFFNKILIYSGETEE
ncbi:MAG: zinc-binding dehydrogenase, partial [Eubacteriaceae bacterium]|nr:zinc-binding dehydrogenase [Eubacteriaceae bacterium]